MLIVREHSPLLFVLLLLFICCRRSASNVATPTHPFEPMIIVLTESLDGVVPILNFNCMNLGEYSATISRLLFQTMLMAVV